MPPPSCPQIINAERAAQAAKQVAEQARQQAAAVEAELRKQKEAAAALQAQLEGAGKERAAVEERLAAAEQKVRMEQAALLHARLPMLAVFRPIPQHAQQPCWHPVGLPCSPSHRQWKTCLRFHLCAGC